MLTQSPTATPVIVTQQVSFVTSDGVTLLGTLYGQGTRAIILSNEGDNNSFAWVPMARQLATLGYLVLGYSYRPEVGTANGLPSQGLRDLRAAIAFIHTHSVTGITLMGSSLGGLISLKEATAEQFDALVPISAPVAFEDVQLNDAELQRITTPKLFVTSDQNDPYTSDPHSHGCKGGVTLSEAMTNIGPLAFDLQPYPLTDAQGRLNLTQTFTLDPDELASITPLTGHVIVLHGAFNQGQYDRFLPAACGPIQAT